MSVQAASNIANVPFILSGMSLAREAEVIAQDASRSIPLAFATVMGKILAEAGAVTADAGNTGDGTVTAFALAGVLLAGDYNLEVVTAVTNGAEFKLEDPNGNIIAQPIVMTAGAGAVTIFTLGGLTFTVTDGSTDLIVGDKFALAVTAVNKWGALDVSAINGLQFPVGIYLGGSILAATIVAGDVSDNPMLVGGSLTVDSSQIVLENSVTVDTVLENGQTVAEALAKIGIFDETTIAIDNFENA